MQAFLQRFQQGRGLRATGQLNPPTVTALGLDPKLPVSIQFACLGVHLRLKLQRDALLSPLRDELPSSYFASGKELIKQEQEGFMTKVSRKFVHHLPGWPSLSAFSPALAPKRRRD
jgi:hypothetical protein